MLVVVQFVGCLVACAAALNLGQFVVWAAAAAVVLAAATVVWGAAAIVCMGCSDSMLSNWCCTGACG